jgi:hypothetical protein
MAIVLPKHWDISYGITYNETDDCLRSHPKLCVQSIIETNANAMFHFSKKIKIGTLHKRAVI